MTVDTKERNCLIIRRNREYLVGFVLGSREIRWSVYAYDAWRTRDAKKAQEAERITGGKAMIFNPITGTISIN